MVATELYLGALAQIPIAESAKQSWLLLRLANEELVTKILKCERESPLSAQSREELHDAHQAVLAAKHQFLMRYKDRAWQGRPPYSANVADAKSPSPWSSHSKPAERPEDETP